MRLSGRLLIPAALIALASCSHPTPAPPKAPAVLPPLGKAYQDDPGMQSYDVSLSDSGATRRVLVFLPTPAPAGKLPCILIGPAGARPFHGMAVGDGDIAEYAPWVHAGFAVVAYDIDGPLAEAEPTNQQVLTAAAQFQAAEAGVANAHVALDYALARVPNIDPDRIYAVGHSSAATLALLVAEDDQRIAGCVAFAPVTDVEARMGPDVIKTFSRHLPGYAAFVHDHSPINGVARLNCPLFLFHADDDSVVPSSEANSFAEAMSKAHQDVTLRTVPTGDHYELMIHEGIPLAIAWIHSNNPHRK